MNIQYLNHPPYSNRWMITLIQQGSVCDLESSEPGCQEDAMVKHVRLESDGRGSGWDSTRMFRTMTSILPPTNRRVAQPVT